MKISRGMPSAKLRDKTRCWLCHYNATSNQSIAVRLRSWSWGFFTAYRRGDTSCCELCNAEPQDLQGFAYSFGREHLKTKRQRAELYFAVWRKVLYPKKGKNRMNTSLRPRPPG